MNLCFAPLEGITGYIYRNAHHEIFSGIDTYFTPFLSPNQNRALSPKEINDIKPEHNKGMRVVPQILTNQSEYFLRAARELKEKYGYEEVNLNLGCPSGTVVTKGKGAGFLGRKEELELFLEEIFNETEMKISVKTRIGMEKPEEFYDLLAVFNKFPISRLTIHPRVREDYYKNAPDLEMFSHAVCASVNPVCYNGDIFTMERYQTFAHEFPQVDEIMLGRGMLVNPALAEQIHGTEEVREAKGVRNSGNAGREGMTGNAGNTGNAENTGGGKDAEWEKNRFKQFHDRLYADYKEVLSGDRDVLFKMKEVWFYMIHSFTDSEKYLKKIKKASRLYDYDETIRRLFAEQNIVWKR